MPLREEKSFWGAPPTPPPIAESQQPEKLPPSVKFAEDLCKHLILLRFRPPMDPQSFA